MITIEINNISKSMSKQKILDLFEIANNNANIVKDGVVTVIQESPNSFSLRHAQRLIGSIATMKVAHKIKHYTVTLRDFTGEGRLKMPHDYLMRTLSSKCLDPEYEEWSHSSMNNSADLFLFYKIFHDKDKLHHYETEVFNYGNVFNITGIKERSVTTRIEPLIQSDFDILFLSYMAFNHQKLFVELFDTHDFKAVLKHKKLKENIDILKMYHV